MERQWTSREVRHQIPRSTLTMSSQELKGTSCRRIFRPSTWFQPRKRSSEHQRAWERGVTAATIRKTPGYHASQGRNTRSVTLPQLRTMCPSGKGLPSPQETPQRMVVHLQYLVPKLESLDLAQDPMCRLTTTKISVIIMTEALKGPATEWAMTQPQLSMTRSPRTKLPSTSWESPKNIRINGLQFRLQRKATAQADLVLWSLTRSMPRSSGTTRSIRARSTPKKPPATQSTVSSRWKRSLRVKDLRARRSWTPCRERCITYKTLTMISKISFARLTR